MDEASGMMKVRTVEYVEKLIEKEVQIALIHGDPTFAVHVAPVVLMLLLYLLLMLSMILFWFSCLATCEYFATVVVDVLHRFRVVCNKEMTSHTFYFIISFNRMKIFILLREHT